MTMFVITLTMYIGHLSFVDVRIRKKLYILNAEIYIKGGDTRVSDKEEGC